MSSQLLRGMTHKKIGFLGVLFFGLAVLFGWLVTEYPPAAGLFVAFAIFFAWGAGVHHVYAIPPEQREF